LGAIYDQNVLAALRFHCVAYVHGHQVGGTNPSLVEALGAGNPVLAHDNRFNRWVAGAGAMYFLDIDQCATAFDVMLRNGELLRNMSAASRARHREAFQWSNVLGAYERLLSGLIERHESVPTTFATNDVQ
jgi:glycosyltransferase involved in cell wall biosynthesis